MKLELLPSIFDALDVQICVVDASEALVMQNAAWGDLTLNSVCGNVGSEDDSLVRQGVHRVLAGDCSRYQAEVTGRAADGQTRWYLLEVTAVVVEQQRLAVLARHDISARKRIELRHEESEAYLRTILESAIDGVVVIDEQGIIQSINPAAIQMFGYLAEQIVGHNVSRLMPEPYASRHDSYLSGARRTTRSIVGSTRDLMAMRRDGSCFPIELAVSAATFSGRRGYIGLIRDVTERHQAMSALRNSEALYRALLDHAPQGVIVVDGQGLVQHCNAQAERWFGPSATLLGSPISRYCATPTALLRLMHTTRLSMDQPLLRGMTTDEIPFRGGQGEFTALVSASSVLLGDSRHVILSINDLSAVRLSHDQQLEARKKADAASRAKSQFLANMTHEIRTPMNSILGMVYLLMRTAVSDKQREYLERLQVSGAHLAGIINDILDFSKIEAGKLELEEIHFDLGQVLAKVESLVGALAQQKGLRLTIQVAEDVPVDLHGDPLRLSQILINLAGNAVKFTDRGGVNVRVMVDNEMVTGCVLRFEVQDTGPGISRRDQKKLFESFQQADDSRRRQHGGTGLGLAISRQLVQLMDGDIGVESSAGLGSVFWFTAQFGKVAPGLKAAEVGEEWAEDYPILQGKAVLLAEDNPFNQYLAVELLTAVGVKVDVAANGLEVLDRLEQQGYDCVLMDMQMPLMDGLEATIQIRTRSTRPQIPVIAMTANVWDEDRERCRQAGVNDFVAKPINPRRFYATLSRWIDGQSGHCADLQPVAAEQRLGGVLDLDQLGALVGGDKARVARFARMFLDVAQRTFVEMDAALANQDLNTLSALGHRLHSSALTLGANEFAEICQQLENCRSGDQNNAARRLELLKAMHGVLQQQIDWLLTSA